MLSQLAGSVSNLLKNKVSEPTQAKAVPELLAALAQVRGRMAELAREEKEILAVTQARLREEQDSLEDLKRKVRECGIEIDANQPESGAAPVSPSEASRRAPGEPAALSH